MNHSFCVFSESREGSFESEVTEGEKDRTKKLLLLKYPQAWNLNFLMGGSRRDVVRRGSKLYTRKGGGGGCRTNRM